MNKQISAEDFQRLKEGKKTNLIELVDPDGQKMTGKLQVFTKDKISDISFYKKEQKLKDLEIGDDIQGIKLDKTQIQLLKKGKFIEINDGVYASIDKDLNKVILQTGKELETLEQIGDYKLTKEDKLALLNGEELTKVLKNQNGNHVITPISWNKEKGQIEIDIDKTKVITPDEAHKYDLDKKIDDLNIRNTEPNRIIKDFLDGNDKAMVQLKQLTKNGFNPSMDKLMELTNGAESSRANAMLGAFNLDSKQFERLKEIYEEKGVYDDKGKLHTVERIDLKDKSVTITSDGKLNKTLKIDKVKTPKEFNMNMHTKSKGKTLNKGIGI